MIALTWAQVHAWRLAQHNLLARAPREQWLDVVTRIGGLHAQVMSAAELALAVRVEGVTPADVRAAIWDARALVKTWAMRGTLHLLPAREYGLYVAALRAHTRYQREGWLKYYQLTLEGIEAVLEAIRAALDGRGLTREELADAVVAETGAAHLGELLRSGWGSMLKPAAFRGYLCFGPSRGQAVTFVRPDQWIGPWPEQDSLPALAEILRRFLLAYGPATRDEFTRWWGGGMPVSQVRPIFAALADELVEVHVEGRPAWALAATIEDLQSPPEPRGVRLLPYFDPYTVAVHPHFESLMPKALEARVYRTAGWISPVVLADGQIVGVWDYEKRRGRLVVQVDLFAPQPAAVREGIAAEAARIAAFLDAPIDLSYS